MLKRNSQSLIKALTFLIMLLATVVVKSQVFTSKFRPFSYDEMAEPIRRLSEAREKAELRFEEYYIKAITELETNNPNYKLASYYYDKCIELNTRFEGTLFNWGDLLYQKGVCLNYIKDNIEANMCFITAANWYSQKKEYSNAIECLSLCLDNQYDGVVMFHRARCWDKIGNKPMSMKDYNTIINKGCSDKTILAMSYNNIAYEFVKLQKYSEALPLVNKAIELDNTISFIWDTRGELHYHLDEYKKCVIDMDKAISITEGETAYGNSYYYRGLAKLKLQKKSEARKDLKKAVKYGNIEAQKHIE